MAARGWSILVFLGAVACAAPQGGSARPALRIGGSEALMAQLVPALAETHRASVGTLELTLAMSGNHDGLRKMLAGDLDMAATTRHHLPAEEEQAVVNGYSLDADGARNIVGVDRLAVVVHPGNALESLTYDQVIGIFCTGSIDNWSFLGLDEAPILALTEGQESGSRELFEDFFCGPRGIHRGVTTKDVHDIRTTVESDPRAISYVSMSEVAGKVLGLRPDRLAHAMLPSQQNIISGSYPLYQDLYLYTPGPATGPAAEFLVWIASPAGQEVVDESGFVPLFLRPDRLDDPRPLRETIHFEAGEAQPNLRSLARLALLTQELRERAGEVRHVVLEGYADNREPDPMGLSRARAEKIREMIEDDLPYLYFEIIPRGATNPIAPNETPYGRLRNRRVQVYLAEEEKAVDRPPPP